MIHIIELKEGYLFDTKKAAGEKLSLQNFENTIAKKIPFATSIHLCCFNCEDKTLIMQGLKQKFTINGYSYSVNNAVLFSPFSSEEIGLDTMQHPIFPIHHTFFFS